MQGNKTDDQKLFYQFSLQSRIPEDNFYRRLKAALDLSFLKKKAASLYGSCGQQSIDTAVLNSPFGRRMKYLRQSTVEPVFGTLINYFGMRKVNTHGIDLAHKSMLMSAIAYNLKKYVKYSPRIMNLKVKSVPHSIKKLNDLLLFLFSQKIFRLSFS